MTRFLYLKDERRNLKGCVAFEHVKGEQFIKCQVSIAHPRDRFDKTIAKSIAEDRLNAAPIVINMLEAQDSGSINSVLVSILQHLATHQFDKVKAMSRASHYANCMLTYWSL